MIQIIPPHLLIFSSMHETHFNCCKHGPLAAVQKLIVLINLKMAVLFSKVRKKNKDEKNKGRSIFEYFDSFINHKMPNEDKKGKHPLQAHQSRAAPKGS